MKSYQEDRSILTIWIECQKGEEKVTLYDLLVRSIAFFCVLTVDSINTNNNNQ